MKILSVIFAGALSFGATPVSAQIVPKDIETLLGSGNPLAGVLGGLPGGASVSDQGGLAGLNSLFSQGGTSDDPQDMIKMLMMVYQAGKSTGLLPRGPYADRDLSSETALAEALECRRPLGFDIPEDALIEGQMTSAATQSSSYQQAAELMAMMKEMMPADVCNLRLLVVFDALARGLRGEFASAAHTYERLRPGLALQPGSNLGFLVKASHAAMLALQLRTDEAREALDALKQEVQHLGPEAAKMLMVQGALADLDFLQAHHRNLGIDDPFVGRPDLNPRASRKVTPASQATFEDGFRRLGRVEHWQSTKSRIPGLSCLRFAAILNGAIKAGDAEIADRAAGAALGPNVPCKPVFDAEGYFASRVYFGRGRLHLHDGNLVAARADLEKALRFAIGKRAEHSTHVRDIQIALAETAALDGRSDDAVTFGRATLEGLVDWLGPEINGAATKDHRRLVAAYARQVTTLAYQIALHAPDNVGAQRLAADASIRFKGLQGDEDAALERIARLAPPGGNVENLAIEISDKRRALAELRLATGQSMSAKRQKEEAELDALELKLGRVDAQFNATLAVRGAGLDAVERNLRHDDVLVEYQAFAAKPLGAMTAKDAPVAYAAAIITPDAVRVSALGAEPEIRSLSVITNEAPLRRAQFGAWQQQLERGLHGFGAMVLAPLKLETARRLIISPDGLLSGAPFHAMMLNDGRRLSDVAGQTVFVVHSGRALLSPPSGVSSGIVAVGGVPTESPTRFLAQTLDEALAAVDAFRARYDERAELLTGAAASKANLLASVNAPRVLHLATHAGFGVAYDDKAYDWRRLELSIEMDPMGRAEKDARITALEVQTMNLEGTDLVVLSACDSAVGALEMGEGLHSLARAFRIAGAEAVIATRRVVDDTDAAAFFKAFYAEWQGEDVPVEAAFAAALNTMWRERPDGDWSAFAIFRNSLG